MVQVYVDDGISAFRSTKHRPGWAELKSVVSAGAIDVLVFDRQDRLARNQVESLRFIADCCERGIRWHSATDGESDLAQPPQLLMATFRSSESEGYAKKIQENVKRRNAADRAKGHPGHGPRPFGYTKDRMFLCEPEAELIRKAAHHLLTGGTKWEVVRMFNESGLATTRLRIHCPSGSCEDTQSVPERRKCPSADTHVRVPSMAWRPSAVYDTVSRWRNAGLVEHQGEPVGAGTWPEILPEADLRAVRAILATPSREFRGRPAQTLLTNLAFCQCGERMHAHGMQWGRVYRCASMDSRWSHNDAEIGHTAIKIALLDDLAREAVVATYLLGHPQALDLSADASEVGRLHETLSTLKNRSNELDALFASNEISVGAYAKTSREIDKRTSEAEARLQQAARASAHTRMLVEAQRRFLEDHSKDLNDAATVQTALRHQFDGLSLEDRRRLVRSTVRLTVFSGRGSKRVEVRYLVAESLDEKDDAEM